MINSHVAIPNQAIEAFCRKWAISELSIFGSALREDFNENSDIDLLVAFNEDASWSLLDFVRMKQELEAIFDRKVDLVSRKGIERSSNPYRRDRILNTAEPVYAG